MREAQPDERWRKTPDEGSLNSRRSGPRVSESRRRCRTAPFGRRPKTRPTGPLRHVGKNVTEVTKSLCGKGARMLYPVAMSQSLSVLSLLPDSAARPSGENATDGMYSACPVKVGILFPAAMSQRATVLPKPLDSAIRPSGRTQLKFRECLGDCGSRFP